MAERDLRGAARLRPECAEAWNGLGHALKQQKNYEDALTAYDEALRLGPEYPEALESLAETYVAMDRRTVAEAIYVRLKVMEPTLAKQLRGCLVR